MGARLPGATYLMGETMGLAVKIKHGHPIFLLMSRYPWLSGSLIYTYGWQSAPNQQDLPTGNDVLWAVIVIDIHWLLLFL